MSKDTAKTQNEGTGNNAHDAARFLDITADVCPMTFVKTKLLLEKMAPGEEAVVRLKSAEPLDNVPRSVEEHGDQVLSLRPEDGSERSDPPDPEKPHLLKIRRG